MKLASQLFDFHFNNENIPSIPFNPAWHNGTGYFDFAVKGDNAPMVAVGKLVKSIANDGRKIIIVGTPLGSVAVFERYVPETSIEMPIVYATTKHVGGTRLIPHGAMSRETLSLVLGSESLVTPDNIGLILERIIDSSKQIESTIATMEVGDFKLATWGGVEGAALLILKDSEDSFPIRVIENKLVINASSAYVKTRLDCTVDIHLS